MKIFLDCLPCMLRQSLEASRMATDDNQLQSDIMSECIYLLNNFKEYRNPPEVAREIHRIVKNRTGVSDPYNKIKQDDIQKALKLFSRLKQFVQVKQDRLYWALRISSIGNVLDSGINYGIKIEDCIDYELTKDFAVCDIEIFKQKAEYNKNLLIIGDNAGETVFDRLLIEEIPNMDVTYAVRNMPIINDAVIDDAYASGLNSCARIISTGCDMPGVVLSECSREFREAFYNAGIVICKGQGNYETLSDSDRELFFLLKAKCPVTSGLIGVGLNDYVFKYYNPQAIGGKKK